MHYQRRSWCVTGQFEDYFWDALCQPAGPVMERKGGANQTSIEEQYCGALCK